MGGECSCNGTFRHEYGEIRVWTHGDSVRRYSTVGEYRDTYYDEDCHEVLLLADEVGKPGGPFGLDGDDSDELGHQRKHQRKCPPGREQLSEVVESDRMGRRTL